LILLVGVVALIGGLLDRMIIRRVFVPLENRSLALLVERRYPKFGDSLLTTVESDSRTADVHVDAAMLDRTRIAAESYLNDVDLSKVINAKPIRRIQAVACLMLGTIVVLAIVQPAVLKIAGQRLYLLDQTAWPRRCHIEMIGVKIKRENPVEGIDELGQTLTPKDRQFRIAKGSTLTLMIQAEQGPSDDDHQLPGSCSLIYRTADGDRGVQTFNKIGAPRDGFQMYSFDGQPFRGILSDVSFDIRGGDHRIGPFQVKVVDQPDVVETKLDCKFPTYIVDESSLRWTNRTIDWVGQSRLPLGTAVTIKARGNKELSKVYAIDRDSETIQVLKPNGDSFEYALAPLDEKVNLQFYLCDTDGLVAEQPHTILLEPIEDQAPTVRTQIAGIGTAVTPDVQIPISGSVEDDYGLQRTWVEIDVANEELIEEPISIEAGGSLNAVIDFKQRRQDVSKQYELPAGNESTVSLVIKSEDRFDLLESPNMGVGDRYVLDIVTPDQLLRILERLEIGQRQRLEQIYLELVDARNYLVRSKSTPAEAEGGLVEPGDRQSGSSGTEELTDGLSEIQNHELRLLFGQRAILQVDKSMQEILGCATAFENIRLQLINNRIDSEDRKKRFSEQIIAPLRLIGQKSMQQLKEDVRELEQALRELQLNPDDKSVLESTDALALSAIEQTDIVLSELDRVLDVLLKYETQNELLEIVRQMIAKQREIMEQTKKERQRKAFDGLLD
jgi:hypothetical protein